MSPRLLVILSLFTSLTVSLSLDGIIQPFPLDNITLEPGSLFDKAMVLNTEYMVQLDADQLLHTFRLNAGMPSSAQPFTGSWEDPSCEVRGQFMGHYISACAMLVNHTGELAFTCMPCICSTAISEFMTKKMSYAEPVTIQQIVSCMSEELHFDGPGNNVLKSKLDHIINELMRVQDALGGEYLSAFPEEHFIRLQSLRAVWAPFYVVGMPIESAMSIDSPLACGMSVWEICRA